MTPTINGVELNIEELSPISEHRNIMSEQPGSDTNFISDMGYNGLVLSLIGYEKTLSDFDDVISEFMKQGAQTLVYKTGWQFSVYSTQVSPFLLQGATDNFFPYELILITSTPYRESTSLTSRPKSITANNETWTQDNSANDIDTDGNVNAIPDIQITSSETPIEVFTQLEKY